MLKRFGGSEKPAPRDRVNAKEITVLVLVERLSSILRIITMPWHWVVTRRLCRLWHKFVSGGELRLKKYSTPTIPGSTRTYMSDLTSDGFVEAKRVYVALLDVCIACLVLSTGNRKKMLRRVPSRVNRIKLSLARPSLTLHISNWSVRYTRFHLPMQSTHLCKR